MHNSVNNTQSQHGCPRMKNAEYMDRTDMIQIRKAERMIAQGGAIVREGVKLKRTVYQRLFMRAKRSGITTMQHSQEPSL